MTSPTGPEEAPLSLHELAETLHDGRWLLAGSVAITLALGALSIFLTQPIYQADGLLHIEDRTKALDPLRDASATYSAETPSEAEIDLIRSRSVVLEVIRELHLDLAVRPLRPPVIGRLWAFGERLHVDALELAPELTGTRLTLLAKEAPDYALLDSEGAELLRGRVGTTASGNGATILVTELSARPGARFSVAKQPPAEAVERFLQQLTVSERGRNTGVIELKLRGTRPDRVQAALAALMAAYLRRDVEHRAAAAERRLQFVNSQLPVLKASLEEAELRLKRYRTRTGQLDISLESKAIIDRGLELDAQITDLKLQLSDLRQRFTDTHPSLVALNKKLRELANARHRLDAQAEARPDTELAWVRLNRDVKVANELYVQLLARAQELAVWKAANIGGVRLVDPAFVQPRPVAPDKPITLAASLFVGVALGLGLALGRKGLGRGIHSAESLERAFELPVYACLPRSRWRGRRALQAPVALAAPDASFLEALRYVRTRLMHELEGAPNKVVLFTSSRPHAGRSFVAVNLAKLLAGAGKRVLLIDADLRQGPLRSYFPQAREVGLAELLGGGSLDELVSPTGLPNFDLLASGALPPGPSELLGGPAFAEAVDGASKRYDFVLCIAPPVLSATDAVIVARAAGSTVLLVKAHEHSLSELGLAVSRLGQCGARLRGFIVTAVPMEEARRRQARFPV